MIHRHLAHVGGRRRPLLAVRATAASLLLLVVLALPLAAAPLPLRAAADPLAAAVQTNTITLRVISARTEPRAGVTVGDQVTVYRFQIVQDNTGDPFDDTDCRAYLDYPPTQSAIRTTPTVATGLACIRRPAGRPSSHRVPKRT